MKFNIWELITAVALTLAAAYYVLAPQPAHAAGRTLQEECHYLLMKPGGRWTTFYENECKQGDDSYETRVNSQGAGGNDVGSDPTPPPTTSPNPPVEPVDPVGCGPDDTDDDVGDTGPDDDDVKKHKSNASKHNRKGGNDGKGGKDRDGSKNSDKGR